MRKQEIFTKAHDLPDGPERARFLKEACTGDDALLAEIMALLKADRSDAFLERPLAERLEPIDDLVGSMIGSFKVLQAIGEGGFGIVYMAEQREPVVRKVALKIIKAGMDTKQVIARFENERQALALMDHPNIARVLEAGATPEGKPYFAMELVRGKPITKFCEEHGLTLTEKLALFLDACAAVQHAHQKSIVHRDLKPNNVLVTMNDGKPMAKIIDFGIAKAMGFRLTEQTLFTRFDQFIGTPAYMSPEQAQMSNQDVDTRTDIYALGVLLYELLTGTTPFDPKTLLSDGQEAMLRTIREIDPPKPSTRVTKNRKANDSSFEHLKTQSEIAEDLDWVVMKALEKDRARRYDTASGLAKDIARYLNHEPVAAAPPSKRYLVKKYLHRHKAALIIAGTILAILIVGITASTILAINYKHAANTLISANQAKEKKEFESILAFGSTLQVAKHANYQSQVWDLIRTALETQEGKKNTFELRNLAVRCMADPYSVSSKQDAVFSIPRLTECTEMTTGVSGVAFGYEDGTIRFLDLRHAQGDSDLATTLTAQHRSPIYAQTELMGGEAWVSTDTSNFLIVWERLQSGEFAFKRGRQMDELEGAVEVSPCGKGFLAFCSGSDRILLWNDRLDEHPKELSLPIMIPNRRENHSHGNFFYNMVMGSPDSQWIAIADPDRNSILIWDIDSNHMVTSLPIENIQTLPIQLRFSADGAKLLVGMLNKISVWDTGTWKRLQFLKDKLHLHGFVFDISPNNWFVVAEVDPPMIWDIDSNSQRNIISGDEAGVSRFIENGKTVRITTLDASSEELRVQYIPYGRSGTAMELHASDASILGMAYHPNKLYLASTDTAGRIRLWDIENRQQPIWERNAERTPLEDPSFSHNGEWVTSASEAAGSVFVWQTSDGELLEKVPAPGVILSKFNPASSMLVLGGRGFLKLWDLTEIPLTNKNKLDFGATPSTLIEIPKGRIVSHLAFSPDGRYLAWIDGLDFYTVDSTLHVWDLKNRERLHWKRKCASAINGAVFLDATRLAFQPNPVAEDGDGGRLEIYDIATETSNVIRTKQREEGGRHLGYSQGLLVQEVSDWIYFYDIASERLLFSFEPGYPVWDLKWSSNGRDLAIGTSMGLIQIINFEAVVDELNALGLGW